MRPSTTVQLVHGEYADTLQDTTPERPSQLKTSEDFRREREADVYPRSAICHDFRVTAAELEDMIARRGFPRRVSPAGWSRAKVAEWREEILALAARLK